MRLILGAAMLAASTAIASDDPFLKGEALRTQIEKDCADGCITWNRAEAELFEHQLNQMLRQKMQEAFMAGQMDIKQRCPSLI